MFSLNGTVERKRERGKKLWERMMRSHWGVKRITSTGFYRKREGFST